jgi:hypothetical protein
MESSVWSHSGTGPKVSWSSVFAGTFVFLAIEATFGLLAWAIFGSISAAQGLSAGAGIWMIILSIIALYFGAKAAAHLSDVDRKLNGMYYGLVTFGLSIFSTILIATMVAGSTGSTSRTLLGLGAANAVWLFATLILGGIAAGIGGAHAASATEIGRATPRPAAQERTTLHPAA